MPMATEKGPPGIHSLEQCLWYLLTLACARNYADVFRRDPGQFGSEEIGARGAIRTSDHSEIGSGTRSYGASIALAHAPEFWTDDAALRASLPVQRMHQQLSLLRFLARQSDSSRPPRPRRSRSRRAASRSSGISADPSRRRRASQICKPQLFGGLFAGARARFFVDFHRGGPDGNTGLCASCRSWRGGTCRLPGDLQSRRICRNAYGRAKTRL